jgi:hypothetical protein
VSSHSLLQCVQCIHAAGGGSSRFGPHRGTSLISSTGEADSTDGGMSSQALPAVNESPIRSAPHLSDAQLELNSEESSGRASAPAMCDGLVPQSPRPSDPSTRPSDSASELRSNELSLLALPPATVRKLRFSPGM